jgi:hypothetical protein
MEFVVSWANQWGSVIQVISNVVVGVGVFLAVLTYVRDAARHNRAVQLQVFKEADDSFVNLHRLMLEQRDLRVSVYDTFDLDDIAPDQRVRSYIFFDILASTLERVFVLFQNAPVAIKRAQWPGWEKYIGLHCRNPLFQEWWFTGDYGYDSTFSQYLTQRMHEARNAKVAESTSMVPPTLQGVIQQSVGDSFTSAHAS